MIGPIQVGINPLLNWLGGILALIPRLFLAAILVLAGFFAGKWVGRKADTLAERMDLGEAVLETPLSVLFRDQKEVSEVIETSVLALFVLAGIVMAANVVGLDGFFDVSWYVLQYLPSVLGAVAIVLVGFVTAGYVARSVKASEVVGGTAFTPILATTIQTIIYFVSVTLALDGLGYSTTILNTLAQAIAIGVGLGVALAIGISVGMGSQDYVAANLDEWLESDRETVPADD